MAFDPGHGLRGGSNAEKNGDRTQHLRRGGGRRNSCGWTEQKRRTNRERFNELRPHIKTAVTIWFPSAATPQQLEQFNECIRNFCKKNKLRARGVWEGPGFHLHIALGCDKDVEIEGAWRLRLARRWRLAFDCEMPQQAFLWKPEVEPQRIASYLLKTRKEGKTVKGEFAWMIFHPAWETGFRCLFPLKKGERSTAADHRVKRAHSGEIQATGKEGGLNSPFYTVENAENEGGNARLSCSVCWSRWGRDLWVNHCKCRPTFPLC